MKTEVISLKNIHSFCRTCLAKIEKNPASKEQKYNISQNKDLSKLISFLTSAVVNKKDKYPKFLCLQCYKKFHSFNEFRSLCMQSQWTLDGILEGRMKTNLDKQISVNTKTELLDDENEVICKAEEYQDENISNETESVLGNKSVIEDKNAKDETDDKTLIASTLINSDNVIEFKDEYDIAINGTDTNLDSKETFEYKNCSEKLMKGVQYVQITNDCIEDGTHSVSDIETEDQNQDDSLIADTESDEFEYEKATDKIPKKRGGRRKDENAGTSVEATRKRELKFKCPHCTRWCRNQENLDAHIRIHQGLKPFQCNQCHRSYTQALRLKAHINDVHVEITCSFEGCGKIFQRNGTYRAHYRKCHTDAQPPMTTYMCEHCGRTFKGNTALRVHRLNHVSKEEYPYHCEQCGKRYTTQRTLKEHQMRHAGIKNFECPICGAKKTTITELRTHINYHTKEKQWHCPHCPSVFIRSANLGLHVRVVHKGIRPFECSHCDQSFSRARTLKHHEMRHTGEKPHACDVCGKRFIQIVSLRTHLKTHNKGGEKL